MSTSSSNDEALTEAPTRLEVMAFDAFYHNFLCKATSSNVTFVRECIEKTPPGTVMKKTRDKCIKKWNKRCPSILDKSRDNRNKQLDISVCVFLDCILDVSFVEELEICVPFQGVESYSKLFSVIAHRCPKLRFLTLTFYSETTPSSSSKTRLKFGEPYLPLRRVTHRLSCLVALILKDNRNKCFCSSTFDEHASRLEKSQTSLLGIVAEFCPVLTKLLVLGFYIKKQDVLALITGTSASTLFPANDDQWTNESVLMALKVPVKYLSPLCFKLVDLCLTPNWHYCNCKPAFGDSTIAFALRHLPALENESFPVSTIGRAIRLLYSCRDDNNAAPEKTEIQIAFEKHCQRTGIRSGPRRLLRGLLGLTTLTSVPMTNRDILRAVGHMCPRLEDIIFTGEIYPRKDRYSLYELWNHESNHIVAKELGSILSDWPKLGRLSLSHFQPNSPLLKPLLSAFNLSLTCLSLTVCSRINLAHLAVCTQLEQLIISDDSSLSSSGTFISSDANTFLPSLKHLECDVCLGVYAHLFERKSKWVHLELNCCHFGKNVDNDKLNEWSQVPRLWPHLNFLSVGKATGLTMDIVSKFVPQLSDICYIGLPKSVKLKQLDFTRKITLDDGCEIKQRVIIGHYDQSTKPCPYQRKT